MVLTLRVYTVCCTGTSNTAYLPTYQQYHAILLKQCIRLFAKPENLIRQNDVSFDAHFDLCI